MVGIVTGNFKAAARIKLAKFNIQTLFMSGGYADDSPERSDILLAAINRAEERSGFRFERTNIVMFGDTPHDATAAKQAGVTSVGVTTGRFNRDELIKAGCDHVFDNLGDVNHVLNTLGIHQ
jgi:phosphoglycolate phosphatase-like HAD superfamily hydrolase